VNAHQKAAFEVALSAEGEKYPTPMLSTQKHFFAAGYEAALASQSETLRALVEALKAHVDHTSNDPSDHAIALCDNSRAALSLAAELGVT
jgi:hypothetical protein